MSATEAQQQQEQPQPQPQPQPLPAPAKRAAGFAAGAVGILILLWIIAGIAAFVMSLVCFGSSGSTIQHLIGLLLAIFTGPFYWIYYAVAKSYCRRSPTA